MIDNEEQATKNKEEGKEEDGRIDKEVSSPSNTPLATLKTAALFLYIVRCSENEAGFTTPCPLECEIQSNHLLLFGQPDTLFSRVYTALQQIGTSCRRAV